jgi:hypothetical protein
MEKPALQFLVKLKINIKIQMFNRTLDLLEKNHLPVFVSFVVLVLGGSLWLLNPFSTDVKKPTEAKAASSSLISISSISANFAMQSSILSTISSSSANSSSNSNSSINSSSTNSSSISLSSIANVNMPVPTAPKNTVINPVVPQIPQVPQQNNLATKDTTTTTEQTVTESSQLTTTNTVTTQNGVQTSSNSTKPEFQLKNSTLVATTPLSSNCPAGQLSVYNTTLGNMTVRKEEDFAQSALTQIKDFLGGSALQKQVGTTANYFQNPVYANFLSNCGSFGSRVIKNITVQIAGADQTRAFVSLNSINAQTAQTAQNLSDPTIEIYGRKGKHYFSIIKTNLVTQDQKESASTKCKVGQTNGTMNETCYEQEMLKLVNDTVIQNDVLALINQFALE